MIEIHELTKRYGDVVAVDHISFTVRPGIVTGFLGPNGAGKSTTMRAVLGLDRPTSGHVTVNGRRYVRSPAPLAEIGALLDAMAVDKARTARNHLLAVGATVGVSAKRVDHLLEVVGLADVGRKRAGTFSLGMGQRLGIATALLADPAVVMLDEPVNGLDPDGIVWIRALLKNLAAEGRTVFLSSHLMNEVEHTADHLVVIGRGRILADATMADFITQASGTKVRVVSPDATALRDVLAGPDVAIRATAPGLLEVEGVPSERIGELAARNGLVLHQLVPVTVSLEEAFMELTRHAVQFGASTENAATAAKTEKAAPPSHDLLGPGAGTAVFALWRSSRSPVRQQRSNAGTPDVTDPTPVRPPVQPLLCSPVASEGQCLWLRCSRGTGPAVKVFGAFGGRAKRVDDEVGGVRRATLGHGRLEPVTLAQGPQRPVDLGLAQWTVPAQLAAEPGVGPQSVPEIRLREGPHEVGDNAAAERGPDDGCFRPTRPRA